tara:strand:- start:5350 stop:6324 length:975 start_codon:yes stop_codon:yes gene_type:complete
MTQAIRIHELGGPDVLTWESVDVNEPGPGEALIRQTAVGLNYIDVYHRTGTYPLPSMPAILGNEAAGVVESIGDGVTELEIGDRVAYCMNLGGYAERRLIPSKELIRLPSGVTDKEAAALMLKGCTVQYLLRTTHCVNPSDTILFHAVAGGCGLIACQWARHLGATMIGTVSNQEKAELAKMHGCEHVIIYSEENVAERVRDITDGVGVQVVYDSVGRDTFQDSLDCLSSRGLMVSFGNSSGPVPPFSPSILAAKGSLYLTRPTLATHINSREKLEHVTGELFDLVEKGIINAGVRQEYPLKDVKQAHICLERRETTGATVLIT